MFSNYQSAPSTMSFPNSGSSYSRYTDLWGNNPNPYEEYANQQKGLGQMYGSRVPSLINQVQTMGGPNAGNGYLANMMGGQKTLADDYVKRAAGAGIQRGGMNVAGGNPLASQLALQATKGLASQYGQDYGQAIGMANQDRNSLQALLSQLMSGESSAYGRQLLGINGLNSNMMESIAGRGYAFGNESGGENSDLQKAMMQNALLNEQYKNRLTQNNMQNIGQQDELNQAQNRFQADRLNRAYEQTPYQQSHAWAQAQLQRAPQQGPPMVPQNPQLQPRQNFVPMLSSKSAPSGPSQQDQATASMQQALQKMQMEAQMQQLAQQARQAQIQTQNLQSQASDNQFKSQMWRNTFAPYMQQVGMAPSDMSIGQRANARLGQALDAAYVWGGQAQPWQREFKMSNNTGVGLQQGNSNEVRYEFRR